MTKRSALTIRKEISEMNGVLTGMCKSDRNYVLSKCGTKNPEDGKYCDLAVQTLAG